MTTTEARYKTAGGRIIEVESHTDFPDDYEIYEWKCPGCRAEKPLTADTRQAALDTARKHADTCRAI